MLAQRGFESGLFDPEDMQALFPGGVDGPIDRKSAADGVNVLGYSSLLPKGEEGFTLGEGQTRFDSQGNVVAKGADKPKSAKLEKIDTGDSIELVDSSTGETVRTIAKTGNTKADEKAIKDQERIFKQTNELRAQVRKVDPDFLKVQDAYTNVEASAQDPSAAGDLALIFNYMKVLDPGSAVKEGEFATAASAGGVDERVFGLYNRILSGERLTDSQRKDFLDRATRLYDANVKKFENRTKGVVTQANKLNIPLDEIGLGQFAKQEESIPAQLNSDSSTSPSAVEPNITTQQQYDALPSGAVYLEDGKRYRKP